MTRARLARPIAFSAPTGWSDIARRTGREIDKDNCFGLAAQLAFYFFLALFPALLFFVALIAFLPIENVLPELMTALGTVAPGDALALLRRQIEALTGESHGGLLTLGIVGAIWSSSAAMVAIIDVLNRAYNVVEFRPWWKRRLLAIGLTVAFALFVLLALVLVLIGPALAERVAGWIGLESAVVTAWSLLRWPTMILLIVLGVDLVYHFAPNRPQRWAWITPGSLLATGLWLLGSFGFKLYVANFAEYNATYGTIGGVIVTLLWFYVSALSILIGAELNGVIAQAQAEARDLTRRAGREEALSPP